MTTWSGAMRACLARRKVARRTFLKSAGAGLASLLGETGTGSTSAGQTLELSAEHRRAVSRRRRIVVQYDPQDLFGIDFPAWIDYPWAEGFFNRNDTAPLPLTMVRGGAQATLPVRISDDLTKHGSLLKQALVRVVLFAASDDERVDVSLNGVALPLLARDPHWKDPQIFSPAPQPDSGGLGDYKIDPRQRLLRLDFAVKPGQCRVGENPVAVLLVGRPNGPREAKIALEKLEFHVRYAAQP